MTAARSVHTWFPAAVSHTPSPGFASTASATLLTVNVGGVIAANAGEKHAASATVAVTATIFTIPIPEECAAAPAARPLRIQAGRYRVSPCRSALATASAFEWTCSFS